MQQRFDYSKAAPGVYSAMDPLDRYIKGCGIERTLVLLIQLRSSQLNGCAYCIDMHWKDLRIAGETEQRLYSLSAWRECSAYSERERAALEWAEAVTLVADGHVPDVVYERVRTHFTEKELADLTLTVASISAWNRLSISARLPAGSYQPAPVTA